jgi:ribosomal protein S18 acetylase RimI-like enzyme
MTATLRRLLATDADAISALLPDLGYSSDGLIVGLCQVQGVRLLASEGYAEIQALVVATTCQGQGFGKKLVAHACEWAFARGYERVRLRSNVTREGAHAFYEHLGFEKAKASYAFELRKA